MNKKKVGRPGWFKLWAEKTAAVISLEELVNGSFDEENETLLFAEIGRAVVSALDYFKNYPNESSIKFSTFPGKALKSALYTDIKTAFDEYAERVKNGEKGGRPKGSEDST